MNEIIKQLEDKISDLYGTLYTDYNYAAENLIGEITQLLEELKTWVKEDENQQQS